MIEKVSSLDEAKHLVDDLNKDVPNWWCPLIRNYCIKQCVCYEGATFMKFPELGQKEYYAVFSPHCGNAMFRSIE